MHTSYIPMPIYIHQPMSTPFHRYITTYTYRDGIITTYCRDGKRRGMMPWDCLVYTHHTTLPTHVTLPCLHTWECIVWTRETLLSIDTNNLANNLAKTYQPTYLWICPKIGGKCEMRAVPRLVRAVPRKGQLDSHRNLEACHNTNESCRTYEWVMKRGLFDSRDYGNASLGQMTHVNEASKGRWQRASLVTR